MRSIQLENTNGLLTFADVPVPKPGPGELLIRVHAAGVIVTELQWRPTLYAKSGEPRIGATPSHEFSGVVEGIGDGIGTAEIGQAVYGMSDWYVEGALAELCIAPFSSVAPKPDTLTHAEAACVPIGALTAWQGLFDRADLQAGERVLIHGGAGGVGVFAIQLAAGRGAHVIATASAQNLDFVTELGAHEVIDYQAARFEDLVHDVDVVFDAVGGETLDRSWPSVRPGGRLVTVVSGAEASTDERIKNAFFIVEPNQKQLSEVAEMLDAGKLRAIVDTVVPWPQAPLAYTSQMQRRGRGKVVIIPNSEI